MKLKI
jgi:hypothetical protein